MSDSEAKPGVVDAAIEQMKAELEAAMASDREEMIEKVVTRVLERIRVTQTAPSEEHQRAMFAASAMNAIILGEVIIAAVLTKKTDHLLTMTQTADWAYEQADAMLAQRAKRSKTDPAPPMSEPDDESVEDAENTKKSENGR